MAKRKPYSDRDKGWIQGVAYSAQILSVACDEATSAANLISQSGLSLADFKRAEVDEYDLKPVRKLFRTESILRTK